MPKNNIYNVLSINDLITTYLSIFFVLICKFN